VIFILLVKNACIEIWKMHDTSKTDVAVILLTVISCKILNISYKYDEVVLGYQPGQMVER